MEMRVNDIVECTITGFGEERVYVKIRPTNEKGIIYKSNMRFVKYDSVGNYISVEEQFKCGDRITAMIDKIFSTGKYRLSITRMHESPGSIFRTLYKIGDIFTNSVVIKVDDGYVTALADGQFKLSIVDDGSLSIGDKIGKLKVTTFDKHVIATIEG